MERNAVAKLFETEPVQHLLTSLKDCGTDDPVELIDVAYWIKGCSSLGRLRYAALLWIGKGKTSTLCLADIKEGTRAAAPRAPKCKMPRDNAVRVVMGAEALSPNLGQRMIATRLLEKSVVVRELTAADLKIEADSMTRVAAANLARYLGGVVGRAHGRQMDSPNGVFGKPSSQGTIRSRWMLRRGCGRAWWNSSPFTKQPTSIIVAGSRYPPKGNYRCDLRLSYEGQSPPSEFSGTSGHANGRPIPLTFGLCHHPVAAVSGVYFFSRRTRPRPLMVCCTSCANLCSNQGSVTSNCTWSSATST
jgi:hypothetical protein